MSVTTIQNEQAKKYPFLAEMYLDDYFPDNLVDKAKDILIELCKTIEAQQPPTLEDFYALTQATTEQFNQLAEEFAAQDSEIETSAREAIAVDMTMVSLFYGFEEADAEEMIANRDW
jgi:hypothetical protein